MAGGPPFHVLRGSGTTPVRVEGPTMPEVVGGVHLLRQRRELEEFDVTVNKLVIHDL